MKNQKIIFFDNPVLGSLRVLVLALFISGCNPSSNVNPLAGKIKTITVRQVDTVLAFDEAYKLDFEYNSFGNVSRVLFNGNEYISVNTFSGNKLEISEKNLDYGFVSTYYVYSSNNKIDSITYLDTTTNAEINYYTFKYVGGDIDSLLVPANQGSPYAYNIKYSDYDFSLNYLQYHINWDYLFSSTPSHYNEQMVCDYTANTFDVNIPLQIPVFDVFGPDWIPYFNTGFPLYLYLLRLNNLAAFKDNMNLLHSVNNATYQYEFATSGKVSKITVTKADNPLVQYISLEYY